ncbi:XylR family transcriptional regulator [Singulisphaera acidiphila]|uniref:Transcriptional regulator n=1 Tax=Singulisphaera acidiphila (strain ATCC BAA-1392 / DSM 18658 / VKM B-2454 / MOB10) TaxID=886293 RepID=L0DF73_SINAD|nr:DNA-binding transcriptional regulator [Singulisphaera acidiphila]AGA27505.1 transcriptional regulator [Singulisphaera acidiphila DSM 18658]
MRRKARPNPPRVAFIIETSMAYGREILHGMVGYVRENGPWTVFFEPRSLQDPVPPWLGEWNGDGIITTLFPQFSDLILKTGIPTIDLDDQQPRSGLPTVQSDQAAIGVMGAEHLLGRGFTRFAFFGYPQFEWSRLRSDAFAATVRAAGFPCDEYLKAQAVSWGHQLPSWEEEVHRVSQWIANHPKPLGLMACNDFRGVQALDACRAANVAVPEEVAVIGVDNETLACELAHPSLSSVIPDCRRIGYEAAKLLDHLMKGGRNPTAPGPVPPVGVATRQSTDVMAISDPIVADSMRFIREHACHGIRIEHVLEHVAVSRSSLHRRFQASIGRTIHGAIAAVRLERVKQLLIETELPLQAIADRAGFSHVEYLIAAFRETTGSTPGAYRRNNREGRL